MGISETMFWDRYERQQESHNRRMPAKPRSVRIEEAMRAASLAAESGRERVAVVRRASELLDRLRADAPALVEHLGLSRAAWKAAATGGPNWLYQIEPARVRSQMKWIDEHGVEGAVSAVEAEVRAEVEAAEAERAAAESMPADAAAEAAYAAWDRRASAALDAMVCEYCDDGDDDAQ